MDVVGGVAVVEVSLIIVRITVHIAQFIIQFFTSTGVFITLDVKDPIL